MWRLKGRVGAGRPWRPGEGGSLILEAINSKGLWRLGSRAGASGGHLVIGHQAAAGSTVSMWGVRADSGIGVSDLSSHPTTGEGRWREVGASI